MSNSVFDAIRRRQSVRRFLDTEIPRALLLELLELADRAPSGFNLQPWHFVIVSDPELRKLLCHVAMDQPQVAEAPATIVFVADPKCWRKRYEKVLKLSLEQGALTPERVATYRRSVGMFFRVGPFGLIGFLKRLALPLTRLKQPVPNLVTSYDEAGHYVCRQTMLAAQNFMIAAKGAGLDTVPMEGFDEYRIKRLLKIPPHMRVPVMVVVGYAAPGDRPPLSARLDLSDKVSLNQFPNRLLPTVPRT